MHAPDRLATLTVLFTDLVGSTRLRAVLGERDAEDLWDRIDAIQTDAVTAEHGRVVKSLGDGLMCVFPAAEYALRAAGQLVARLDQLAARVGQPVEARVGVSAGDLLQADGDVSGTPAIEAARLCDAAGGGEILVSDVVRVLAGAWSDHPLDDRGERRLKGLPAPVRCWSLAWRCPQPRPAQDVGLLVDDEFSFVGRDAELTRLEDAWTTTRRGVRTAILLAGEAGVGKTRLAVQMAHRVLDEGGLVLAGRCEQDTTVPLEPVQHLVGAYAAAADPATLAEAAGPFAPELARHIVSMAAIVDDPGAPDADRDAERFRLFAGITHLLHSAARRRPVLVIIDDLQWADAASWAFLGHLLRTADLGAICVIATFRDTGADGATAGVGALLRLPGVSLMQLEGLPVGELAELVAHASTGIDAVNLWDRTRGHPFFAVELIRRARAGGDDTGVPVSVRDLVLHRTAQLRPATVRLLTIGALIGYAFDVTLAAEVAGLTDPAAAAVEEAVVARLLLEVPGRRDRVQFTHALVADTLATQPSQVRVAHLHEQIAGTLRRRAAPSDQIAEHTLRAVPVIAAADAITVVRDAARDAMADGEPDQAAALLERALQLDLSGMPQVRAELEVETGECLNHASRAVDGVPHFEAAARLADEHGRFDLLYRAALGCWAGNPWFANADETAQRLLQLAIDRCPPADQLRRAALRAGLAAFSIFTARLADRDRITRDAVALARARGDRTVLSRVLVARHVAIGCPLALDALDEVRRELAPLGADVPLATAPGDLTGVSASDFWRADGAAYRRAATSFDLSDPRLSANDRTVGSQLQACVALLDGRTADARVLSERALAVGSWGDASIGNHGWQLLLADWLDGRVVDSRARAAAAYRHYGGQPTRLTHAWTEAAAGASDTALALLDRVGRERLSRVPELFLGSVGLAAGAAAVVTLGAVTWAEPFLEALTPLMDQMCGVPWAPFPAAAFYAGQLQGLLGDVAAADRSFTRAVELHERMQAPAFVALTQAEHGRVLLGTDRPRAARLLREAEVFARDVGIDGILQRVTGAR